ncbi:Nucleotide-diphospho-sugar transferase family-containing protein [Strongyloides ratti]|uniref:Nucleotide-diphospho-sugar transferase family-containing protein n=1 Tax=Strongyloides ratti TaxID=34506 RepID=A0A090L1T2_STRRB|nr:Nucleotide-diphospho-sugar transferase family-containing protein [Strongyloides ratti]CEF62077.1 Nucleotide-diphospho-sugar transferase family-containing protein [Strongyloides ratti]
MFTKDNIIKSSNFENNPLVKDQKKPLLVFILNKYALNMTFNFLCNTKFIENVHKQILIIALDMETKDELLKIYPDIHVLLLNISCLHHSFNYGDGYYQSLYVLRAKLSLELLNHGYSFFMAQQDTFWRDSLLNINISLNDDIIFDSASSKFNLIAGGHYYTHPTERSKKFFSILANDLSKFYAPDNAYMTLLCYRNIAKCGFIKFNLITNWIWLFDEKLRENFKKPMLIQFDGHTELGGKLNFMKKLGFYFIKIENMTCDKDKVDKKIENLLEFNDNNDLFNLISFKQFSFYQTMIEIFYSNKITEFIMNEIFFPYSLYLMITL